MRRARRASYNENMARGWESKSVESQMDSASDGQASKKGNHLTSEEQKTKRERDGLLLARANVVRQLEASTNDRYSESLRRALNELDKKIETLGK